MPAILLDDGFEAKRHSADEALALHGCRCLPNLINLSPEAQLGFDLLVEVPLQMGPRPFGGPRSVFWC